MNLDFQQLLNSMASAWVVGGLRARLASLGVDWTDWPECDAKTFVRRWETETDKRAVVEFDLAEWETKIAGDALAVRELPEDNLQLQALYQRHLKKAYALNLAERLRRNPEKVDEILADTRIRRARGVDAKLLAEVVMDTAERRQKDKEAGKALLRIPGFPELSEMIGGFGGGRVMILGAVTGFGKTTLALNLASGASKLMPVVLINQEMPYVDVGGRAAQIECNIGADDWNRWRVNLGDVIAGAAAVAQRKDVWITDGRSLSLDEIQAFVASKLSNREGIVFIDYDQKIATEAGADEWRALALAIQRIEEMAKSLNVFVVLLSQFHDTGEVKASKRMTQSASAVAFFHKAGEDFFIEFSKNRFGPRDVRLQVAYDTSTGRITEMGTVNKPRRKTPLGIDPSRAFGGSLGPR